MIARLGEEAVSLNVPMKVDLKFGKTWGDAVHSLGGADRRKPRRPKPAPTAPLNGAKPAITIPLSPRSYSTQARACDSSTRNSTQARDRHPVAATRAGRDEKEAADTPPPLDDTEIDLADLVDCAGAAQPHGPVPVPRRNKAEHADLHRSLLLFRLRRMGRSCRLAGAGRGPRIRPGARRRRQLGRPGHPAIANARRRGRCPAHG